MMGGWMDDGLVGGWLDRKWVNSWIGGELMGRR